ncbi:unnamed protein product [Caenorhabditis brenneri]
MWPSESDLEPIDSIIDRMNPMPGFPYPMKSAINKGFPKSVGDPWIGAYTKNGYWFKLSWGGNDEFKEIANEMWYRNEFLVDSKSFELYQKAIEGDSNSREKGNLKMLVAKNIRGEVLGIALISKNPQFDFSIVGPIFVQEDFRHVGIGSVLFEESTESNSNIAFNSVSYLLPTIRKYKLEQRSLRNFGRIRVKNSSGFANLKEEKPGIHLLFGTEITEDQWEKVDEFAESCTNEKRNWKAFVEEKDNHSQLVAAFEKDSENCVGISVLREIQNDDGRIPDLLVSPLYAKSSTIAEILIRKTLKKHYNPEDDYDFDVDHLAIYRRTVNFFVFSSCESTMLPLLKKLAGSDGKIDKDRLIYQTCSNFQLPAINHALIFAMSDPNVFLSDFQCQNGKISSIECKKSWFGITSCENKTLVCEQKSHCCPKPAPRYTGQSIIGDCTTMSNGIAETVEDDSSTISNTNTGIIGVPGCEKCDIVARHSCFLSLHIESNGTVGELNSDCLACENCCDDAFPHKCEVWKNHDFCDMSWYSRDKKLILCGKTCGLC